MEKNKLIFKEYKSKAGEKSSVWQFFLRTEGGTHAQCIKCKKVIKCQNTTTCLHNHLKLHKTATEMPTTSQQTPEQPSDYSKRRKMIDMYFQATEDKMEDVIAKMTACDGLPFSVFCTSESIQKLFKKSGYQNIPKSPNTIKKIVVTKCNELKSVLKKELEDLKNKGMKFSVSLDEWTSARNRRYMNVNLHSPQFQNKSFRNLGLIRITGRGTAEHCINILDQKLKQYDVDIEKDIACGTTDGASVMCSMGRKMPSYHQQCLAHGIQCAVVDVIYKTKDTITSELQEMADNLSESSDTDDEEEEGGFVIHRQSREKMPSLLYHKDLVNKVRTVVKLFKKSPTKYEILEKYTQNNKKTLILDCKTRWSSMADMISRFLDIKEHIMKALIDVKSDISFSNEEIKLLSEFSTSLNIIKTTVEAICAEDANFLTCETALQFMVNKLQNINTFISRQLLEALKERIEQRRQPELVCTLKYLHNPKKYYDEAPSSVFTTPGNDIILKTIVDINEKYFKNHSTSFEEEDDVPLTQIRCRQLDETMDTEKSLKEQLQKRITDTVSSVPSTSSVNLADNEFETSVRMQMALYDVGGLRQVHLEQVYNFLLCIPPTSVECERVFSSSKYLCNHLRSSLKDDSLDALSFLRSHYQRQINKK